MVESKSMKVGVENEQSTIELMEKFGWSLKSSQEINSKESHEEVRNGELYSVTTSENYVKLVFSRNTEMANYKQIVDLEKKYFSILAQRPAPVEPGVAFFLFLLLIFPCVLYVKSVHKKEREWEEKMRKEGKKALADAQRLLQA